MPLQLQSPLVFTSPHANDTGFVKLARSLDENNGAGASVGAFLACIAITGLISWTAGYLRSLSRRAAGRNVRAALMEPAGTGFQPVSSNGQHASID